MFKVSIIPALALSLFGLTLSASAKAEQRYNVDKDSTVGFFAKITASNFTAETETVSGGLIYNADTKTITKASIAVDASSFKTGMGLRDTHMSEKYLESEKFPVIQLQAENIVLDFAAGKTTEVEVSFVVKGVTQKKKIKVKVAEADAKKVVLESEFPIDITDFGIKQPRFKVVKMETEVKVSVRIILAAAA